MDKPISADSTVGRAARAAPEQACLASPSENAKQPLIMYGMVIAPIIAALLPALFFAFGYHNDYNAWSYDSHTCCNQHPETSMLIEVGRYFGAYAQNLQFFTIRTLAALWVWRLVGILSVAGLSVYYLHIVSLQRPLTWRDTFLSVAVFTLPTMQFQAIWVSMYSFWTPPILLSLIGAHLLIRATDGLDLANSAAIRRCLRLTSLAFVSMLAGCFFYPMSAAFLLVPVAHLLLTEKSKQYHLTAILAVMVFGSAFVALFAIHKFIVLPHLSNVPYLGEYSYSFSGNLLAEATRRLIFYLREGAYLWFAVEIPMLPKLVGAAAFLALICCVIRVVRGDVGVNELINVALACGLLMIALGPVLIVDQFAVTYRIRLAMNAIELLLFFWLLSQFTVASSRIAAIFAVVGLGASFVDVYGTAAASGAEHALYAKSVTKLSERDYHSIAILRPFCCKQAFGLPLKFDLGVLAPIPGIFDLLIGPRYNNKATFDVTTIVLGSADISPNTPRKDYGLPLAIEKNAIVIDTSSIYHVPSFASAISQLATVSVRPRDTRRGIRFGPANAVDGLPSTFWETAAGFPISLELEFPTAHLLRGYSLSTVDTPERMPSNWEICVSADRSHWHRLQKTQEGAPWKHEEIRHYSVPPTSGVKGIKLLVNATDDRTFLRLYEFRPEFVTPSAQASEPEVVQDASALKADDDCQAERKDSQTPEAKALPQLLYAYEGYNIVQVGDLYIGIAQDLGPTNIDAVLSGSISRPPPNKFIVAHDASEVEAAIDRYVRQARK
jgi:hypothetical protein